MKWLSNLAINKPVTTIMLVITMVIMGLISMFGIPVESMPDMDFPVVTTEIAYAGVSPEDMEDLVAEPVEDSIEGIEGIKKIQSYSSEGFTYVVIWFDWGVDLDQKVIDIKDKITKIRVRLPEDIEEPIVSKIDIMGKDSVMDLNLSGNDLIKVRRIAEDKIKPKLERIPGVASVDLYGGLEKEVLVKVDPLKLENYGFNINTVIDILRTASVNMPAGKIKEGDKEFLLRVIGKIDKIENIKKLVVYNKNGKILHLEDIVDIYVDNADRDSYNRMDGKESISLTLIKESGGNTVQISENVKKNLEMLRDELSEGMKLTIGRDSAEDINDSMDMVKSNAILGLLLAAIILLVFLKNIRATLIVATAIPTSIIFTFVLIKYKGITINMLSLGGLALGVGMLVDNSVIVLENIYRHITEKNKPVFEAARDGAAEMGLPILASTATTVAVFLPVAFTKGIAGEIFSDFSYTVAFSLIASMIVALTFVPMISSKVLNRKNTVGKEGKIFGKLKKIYRKMIIWALRRKFLVVFLTIILFIGSMVVAVKVLGREFFPKTDMAGYTISAKIPSGLDLEKANRIAIKIEDIIKKDEFTEKYITKVRKDLISISVDIPEKEKRKKSTEEIMSLLRKKTGMIPDVTLTISPKAMGGGPGGSPIEVKVAGDDYVRLEKYSKIIQKSMENVKGVVDIENSYEGGNPEIKIRIDREKAEYFGLSVSYISSIINSKMLGIVPLKLQSNGEEIDVKVELKDEYKDSIVKVNNILIPLNEGGSVRLKELAKLEISEGPSRIIRQDGNKVITITANPFGRDLGGITKDLQKELNKIELPKGYSYEFDGEQKDMQEMMVDLIIAFLVAIFLVYMILASQFESFTLPLIIMISVPLALIGVVVGLLVTGFSISMTVMIGIIMLAGIVVNNAIVLIDYINLLKARGVERHLAIKEAGETRLRPILMTTMTTIFGMVPLATGRGAGGDFYQPLAITVIFFT
ncbi:MAG: hypothetical protein B6I28_01465 [Fusobacteriia bacterium 4572_132]|nr:MAG: hypothetical protein B6I28_01465 [Fusobacteriia bacterium 4572_132]